MNKIKFTIELSLTLSIYFLEHKTNINNLLISVPTHTVGHNCSGPYTNLGRNKRLSVDLTVCTV